MNVATLISLLEKMPKDAEVFINETVVSGIELHKGRLTQGYACMIFKVNEKGHAKGVTFTHTSENTIGMFESRTWHI